MKKQHWFSSGDIMYDVLPRLYTKDLVKLKRVSKEWKRVMSERAFIKAQLQKMEPLAGFFYQDRDHLGNNEPDRISYIPAQRLMTPFHQDVTPIHRDVLSFLPERVTILDSRNGLVCCRSNLDPVIYVCNPLNKDWKALQWPNPSKQRSIALVFEPSKNSIKELQNFNAVIVSQEGDGHFSFNIYSSATGKWETSNETCVCSNKMLKKGCVCVQGILYWLLDGDQILMFDLEADMSCLINLPMPTAAFSLNHDMFLGESEGYTMC